MIKTGIRTAILLTAACGGSGSGNGNGDGGNGGSDDAPRFTRDGDVVPGGQPHIAGCGILPANHIFNTPIDSLPVHGSSDAFITTIGGGVNVHLDLGTTVDQQDPAYYGIPYNVVAGNALTWPQVSFTSPDPDLDWDPLEQADCANSAKTLVRPCTGAAYLPIPAAPLVEGGVNTDAQHQPPADHHILVLDSDTCWLWETYHSYKPGSTWEIFGAAAFDLASNDLHPDTWTSADAAGFPILPLLLRADEASSGEIKHALRFTIPTGSIRGSYTWPATHKASSQTSMNMPQYGQLFRLKADFAIPSNFNTQSKAILTAMKTYGMYIADGGSAMYVTGEPSALWADDTFSQVQSVEATSFEAVDLDPIKALPGWSISSGAVP
jgi:hypothetical protein